MAVGFFTVLAGDFAKGQDSCYVAGKYLHMKRPRKLFREKIPISQIASVEVAGEESGKSFGISAATGLAGGLLLGPVGAVAGLLAGGNRNTITFALTLADGRSCLCTAKAKAFREMQAAAFGA